MTTFSKFKKASLMALVIVPNLVRADFIGSEVLAVQKFKASKQVEAQIEKASKSGLRPGSISSLLLEQKLINGFPGVFRRETHLVNQALLPDPRIFHPYSSSVLAAVSVTTDTITGRTVSEPKVILVEALYEAASQGSLIDKKLGRETIQAAVLRAHKKASAERLEELQARGYEVHGSQLVRVATTSGFAGYSSLDLVVTHLSHPKVRGNSKVIVGVYEKESIGDVIRGHLFTNHELSDLLGVNL